MTEKTARRELDPVHKQKHKRARILLIDDEELLRDVWQEALAEEGYDVETAESPEHAFLMLEREHFDLVLLDEVFKTGPYDGLDAFRKIRQLHGSIPVIMMTGYSDVEDNVVQAVREGAYRQTIKKPSTLAEITDIVSNCLLETKRNPET